MEISDYQFPLKHTGPGGEAALPGGFGVNKSAYRDEYQQKYYREVDAAFAEVTTDDPLPLILVGVDRNLSYFEGVTSYGALIAARLLGNHDNTSPHDLGKLLWPLVLEKMAARRQELLEDLDTAVGAQRSSSTLGEAWLQAQMGRVATLLVEEDYHQPARLSESGMLLTSVDEPGGSDVMDDAVDDLVELVLQKGGEAFFFGDGALATHGRVAVILRY